MKKTNTSNPLKYFNDKKDEAYKKAGGEIAAFKKSLKRMDNGGGSGMGRMAADDAAFDAIMNPPTSSPRTSPYPSSESARLLAAQAAMTMQGSNVQNANIANAARLANIKTPTRNIQLENYGISPYKNKKGGSVGRKK